MIPVSLNIQGLYSYREAQTIDFTALTSSGLFGIFGAVGSGKSSILEAIMFVLYDKSDRLNYARDNRYYNMLNLQSDELMLDFVFFAGSNNADKYRFRFVARRSKKDFEKVEVKESSQYKWVDEAWLPLEGVKDASEILGMSYENFMQTIIIPQGRFREFIDRSATDRTKMLKELFHLNKYDLSQKTSILLNQNKGNIDNLEGRLQELGDVDLSHVEARDAELNMIKDQLNTEDLKCKAAKAEEQTLRVHKTIFQQIRKLEGEKIELNSKKEFYELKEKQVQTYEKAFTYLKEKISNRETLAIDLQQTINNITLLRNKYDGVQQDLKKNEEDFLIVKETYQTRDEVKQKYEDLEIIIKLKYLIENIERLKEQIENEKKAGKEAEEAYTELRQLLESKEQQVHELEMSIPDLSKLQEVYHWYQKKEEIQQELYKHKQNIALNREKLVVLEQDKLRLFSNGKASLEFEEIAALLKEEILQYDVKRDLVNKEIQKLLVQQKLSDLTINLKDEEPCPLCGSLHHPSVMEVHGVYDALQMSNAQIRELSDLQERIRKQETVLQKISLDYKNQQELLQEKEEDMVLIREKLKLHEQQFAWPEYKDKSLVELGQQKTAVELQVQHARKLKEDIKKIKVEIPKKEAVYKGLEEKLKKYENEICGEEASQKTLNNQLKKLKFEKFSKFTFDQLSQSLQKGQQQYLEIEKKYEEAVATLQQLKMDDQMLKEKIIWAQKDEGQLIKKLEDLDGEILQSLQEKGFSSLAEVKSILKMVLNLEAERKELQQYYKEVHANEAALRKSYEEADGFVYKEDYHSELLRQLERIESRLEELRDKKTLLTKEIEDLSSRLAIKKECETEREKLKEREQNLKELRKLFMGNGFVRYVSSVYLQDLCKAANKRFFKLTNNSLSLELNKEEEFIVRDYLNNGKTRLLKTLSGGQTFQAALCLALALAENVKSINKADKSFFFLDEGFGSLDKESLRVVFDTLKTLRNENRIVGIISHVEDLQQEIDLYLKIENDKDKGSLVKYSWNQLTVNG